VKVVKGFEKWDALYKAASLSIKIRDCGSLCLCGCGDALCAFVQRCWEISKFEACS
jgi:hypothetical protein